MWVCSRNMTNSSLPASTGGNQAKDRQKDMAGRTGDLTQTDTVFLQSEVLGTQHIDHVTLLCVRAGPLWRWIPLTADRI